jgi:hypothetical protein
MPTTLPPSHTGKPETPSCSDNAITWRTVDVGRDHHRVAQHARLIALDLGHLRRLLLQP